MWTEVLRLDLLLRRRSMIGFALGMAVYAFAVVALYPAFKNDSGLDAFTANSETVAALFGVSGSLTSPSGWLNANMYSNFLPLIVLLLTVGYGAACLAGQDEDGTLGPVAALPISRRRIATQKFGAMALLAVPVAVLTGLCVLAGRGFELDVGVGPLIGTTVGILLLGIAFGALAMAVGAATGSRGAALGITSAVAAAAYLVNSLAPVVDWLKPWRFLSPFFYAIGDGQLDAGLPPAWAAVLVGMAAVFLGGALVAFERLDVH